MKKLLAAAMIFSLALQARAQCTTCLQVATCTPTNTPTITNTPTNTPTRTPTPTFTPSNTPTPATPGTGGTHVWSTTFGGPNQADVAKPIASATDSSGATVILGTMQGNVNFGGGVLVSAGVDDLYVVKYSATGVYQWSFRYGGAQSEVPKAIAVDASGNVIITGFIRGSVALGGSTLAGTSASAFLAKYSSLGVHVWSKKVTTVASVDEGTALITDASGNIYLGVGFYGTTDFGAGAVVSAGGEDIALVKYDSAGTLVWANRYGTTTNEFITDIAVETNSEPVMTGYFSGAVDFGGGALTSAGNTDVFVARYTTAGVHVWSNRYGSTSEDKGKAIAVLPSGVIVLTGTFYLNVDFGGGALTNDATRNTFVLALASNGTYGGWTKNYGGSNGNGAQIAGTISTDAAGNVLVTGGMLALSSAPYTVDFGAGAQTGNGYYNPYVAKYTPAGAHVWSRRWIAGQSDAFGVGIGADSLGNIYAVGQFQTSVDFGGGLLSSPGGENTYLVKFTP